MGRGGSVVRACDWQSSGRGFESCWGRLETLAISFTPLCQCLSEETLKAVGPFYLVSMPGEVKDPTSLHWKCVTCRGLHHPLLGRVHTCSGSRSGPVPLVRVAFKPAKIDRTRSGCGPVTCSHLFRNATGTRPERVRLPPPQHTRFLMLGMLSSRRVTALTASRHRRRRFRIDGQIRRCMMCPNFGLQRNFGRCIII